MKAEIQKALNDLYHKDGIDLELLNTVVSYIENLEYKNKSLAMDVTKLTKKIEYEMMPIKFIVRQADLADDEASELLRRLIGDYMDGKGEDN